MTLAPLTQERLTNFLTTSEELRFAIDDDGEIGIPFDEVIVWITLKEQLMNLRGNIRGDAKLEDLPRVVELVETCNRERTGPKAYWAVGEDEDGNQVVHLAAECTMALTEWTDEQLKNFFHVSMGQLISYAQHLTEELPYLVEKEEDQDGMVE
ncbi:YbjN domain-containing protein [Boudabousia marimammalium]|uniref:YbjN domain-containing protein n=1 Tax=Boudabousia marimammalium TaxID=156892 RepID=A0A1Q5PRY3_9ACTO|nr:YbjN domain-containing protein [Boudabousia marimammalium]OKL50344.1 hypothetical protein BM477_02890 [Boudabousia marimammalium]